MIVESRMVQEVALKKGLSLVLLVLGVVVVKELPLFAEVSDLYFSLE